MPFLRPTESEPDIFGYNSKRCQPYIVQDPDILAIWDPEPVGVLRLREELDLFGCLAHNWCGELWIPERVQ